MSRRLSEPPSMQKHGQIMHELNEMSIRLKIHKKDISEESAEQQAKIIEARKRHPDPTTEEIISILERCRDEMDLCREPYKKY